MKRALSALLCALATNAVLFAQSSGTVVTVTNANYTCDPSNDLVLVTASTSNVTVTLPRANAAGQIMNVVVLDGTNAVTVVKNPLDVSLVDPAGDAFMGGPNGGNNCPNGESVTMESDGTGRWIVTAARNSACGNWVTSSSLTTAQAQVPKATGSGQMIYWDNTNHQWVTTTGHNFAASISTTGNTGLEVHCTAQSGTNLNSTTNFLNFYDGNGAVRGSIQGQNLADLTSDPNYQANIYSLNENIAIATINLAIATAQEVQMVANVALGATPGVCVGVVELVACEGAVEAVGNDLVDAANVIMATANVVSAGLAEDNATSAKTNFISSVQDNLGVTYTSNAADYAEWLPKQSADERFAPGQIVGVQDGRVSKSTDGATQLMVISERPIVLGNVPEPGKESAYEKVSFMGQVPVRVVGPVNRGDYILPSGTNSGCGVAVAPDRMKVEDYRQIVGIAWSGSADPGTKLVNVAVGLNGQALSSVMEKQAAVCQSQLAEIQQLHQELGETREVLAKLVPGFKESITAAPQGIVTPAVADATKAAGACAAGASCSHAADGKSCSGSSAAGCCQNSGAARTEATSSCCGSHATSTAAGNSTTESAHRPTALEIATQHAHHLTMSMMKAGLELVRRLYTQAGHDPDKNPYLKKLNSDASFRDAELARLQAKAESGLDRFQDLLSRRAGEGTAK